MRLLLALGIGYAHAAGSCQVCTASKDYKGDFIGAGDEGLCDHLFLFPLVVPL